MTCTFVRLMPKRERTTNGEIWEWDRYRSKCGKREERKGKKKERKRERKKERVRERKRRERLEFRPKRTAEN